MLKARAIERWNDAGQNGKSFSNSNVYAALLSNIWETFEQQGVRDELTEMLISCDAGMIAVMRISPMLLAIVSDGSVPIGQLKVKLRGLSEHLQGLADMV
uniref:Uncharacterized protein n=1 Tax=Ditylenchus dipsaci TaxID=166011 RepID=A0A915CPH1_9BILA